MVYIYEDEFYQWSDGRKVTEQKKCEILNNFISAMEFQGVDVEIQ